MSKIFIFVLSLIILTSVISYQFLFTENNRVVNYFCSHKVASFCEVDSCESCVSSGLPAASSCTLVLDPNNYFGRGGTCAFTEKSQCEWKKSWKTGVCSQLRSIDNSIKKKLNIGNSNKDSVDIQEGKIYFGNEARGDFNGDGKEDVAFLFTEDGGGSGTFYYVTVRLAGVERFKELNAILLGDRIAPQTTEFKDGMIIVNYADRKPNEPMTARPSVGVSSYFQVVEDWLVKVK